jgi:hypothetical protein
MGHYDSAREAAQERDNQIEECAIASSYESLLSSGRLSDDKLRDAVIYLLGECQSFSTVKREAEIHRRRLQSRAGFER